LSVRFSSQLFLLFVFVGYGTLNDGFFFSRDEIIIENERKTFFPYDQLITAFVVLPFDMNNDVIPD